MVPPLPGSNVFITSHDATTPVLPDGSRSVTCRQLDTVDKGRLAAQALKQLVKIIELP